VALEVEFVEVEVETIFEVEMAEERSVGRSRISESRSMFLETRRAFLRLSRSGFSDRLLYVSLKWIAASSNFGKASRREAVDFARVGSVVPKVDKCVEEFMIALCERFDRAWTERRRECVVWDSD
jgi:hypothetical protein